MLESDPAADVLHFVRPDTATFDKRTSMKVEQRLDCWIEGAFRRREDRPGLRQEMQHCGIGVTLYLIPVQLSQGAVRPVEREEALDTRKLQFKAVK